jgi:hypothetical protein
MTHQKSSFIWQNISVMSYLQFPWRYLVTTTFFLTLALGFLFQSINHTVLKLVLVGLIIFFNISFFRPIRWIQITPEEKIIGNLWEKQLTISIFDYLPKVADFPPTQVAPTRPYFTDQNNKGAIYEISKKTNQYNFSLKTQTGGEMVIPLFNYPGWIVEINNKKVPVSSFSNLGLISFKVEPGDSRVRALFQETPLRLISNIISLISVTISLYILRSKKYV